MAIFYSVSLLMSSSSQSFKVKVMILQQKLLDLSNAAICSETQRGDHFWGSLGHLPAIHETVYTSEKIFISDSASSPYAVLHHFHSFCCSFTNFNTKLYHHSLPT
jgi:hypothetical protein